MGAYINGIRETDKIDRVATLGLLGTSNSLAYRIHEIERHLHSGARWFEKATTPNTELHVADRIGSGAGAFRIDGGNDTWGSWVQILGSSDTPTVVGKAYFDPHQILIESAEKEVTYFIQFARGASGSSGYEAGTYTELMIGVDDRKKFTDITTVQTGRSPSGDKLWARCMCPGEDTGWLDFYLGLHEYEG